jgi:hypothetical protein
MIFGMVQKHLVATKSLRLGQCWKNRNVFFGGGDSCFHHTNGIPPIRTEKNNVDVAARYLFNYPCIEISIASSTTFVGNTVQTSWE